MAPSIRDTLRMLYAILDVGARRRLLFLLAIILGNSLLELLGIGLLFFFLQVVTQPERLDDFAVVSGGFSILGIQGADDRLTILGLGLIGLFLLKNAAVLWIVRYRIRFITFYQTKMVNRLFRIYMRRSYADHLRSNSADLARNLTQTVGMVFGRGLGGGLELITESLVIAAVATFLFFTEPIITAFAFGLLGLLFVGTFYLFARWTNFLGRESHRLGGIYLKLVAQALGGSKEIRVLNREHLFESAFVKVAEDSMNISNHTVFLQVIPRLVLETLLLSGVIVATLFILSQNRDPNNLLAVLGLFAVAAVRLMPSFNKMLVALSNIRLGRASVEQIYIENSIGVAKEKHDDAAFIFARRIEIEGVWMTYPGADRPALADVSLTIEKGQSIGLVGPSGAGKTSLVDLLLGLYEPSEGGIHVDGRSIGSHLRAWRRHVGYVPQNVYLGDDTLRRNICFGIPDDEIDESQVLRAIALAQMSDFVAALPEGLDTVIGEHGVRLSGGQRQRVGIARAIYGNPDLVILDEATSALDSETEWNFTQEIAALRGDKTVIIIAHRLSTVRQCDKIVFLANGRVEGIGTFAELTKSVPAFRRIVQLADLSKTDHFESLV